MNKLNELLKEKYNNILNAKNITGLTNSQKAHVISMNNDNTLVICSNKSKATKMIKDLEFYSNLKVVYFPAREIKYYTLSAESREIENTRMDVITKIINKSNMIIVTTIDAVMQRMLPLDHYSVASLNLEIDEDINLDNIIGSLNSLGYERCEVVSGKGQYSVRGGIIDIYSLSHDNPYRVELFGDTIDSIREFDAISQRSINNISKIDFSLASEYEFDNDKVEQVISKLNSKINDLPSKLKDNILKDINLLSINSYNEVIDKYFDLFEEKEVCFLDYLNGFNIYIDELDKIENRANNVLYENNETIKILAERESIYMPFVNRLFDFNDIKYKFKNAFYINSDVDEFININSREYAFFHNNFELLFKDINNRKDNIILFVFKSKSRITALINYFKEKNIIINNIDDLNEIKGKGIYIINGSISNSYEYIDLNITVITESTYNIKKKKKNNKDNIINSFEDLKIGDYIVHENHGIGIYRGIEEIVNFGVTSSYIKLEYLEGSSIYIPMSSLDNLRKYIVDDGIIPKVNKLGSSAWNKTKSKAKKHIDEIAKELVLLYAKRENSKGFAFSKDTSFQKEFEDDVEFELTEDQKSSIDTIKEEMEEVKPMDMLLCGDVGYGKTEVAIRAAFKAVVDNKQVAYLVPTTVLCFQQYNTFKKRMDKYGIKVEMLSRFKTKKQQEKIVEKLKYGNVDIIIGTHRMLSEDVSFKDLGLLIIDEEHRFGVKHKEKVKELKSNIDVISMTATPIPRTLHMSMIGIRSMTTLMTPPMERLPVHTYVIEQDDNIVKEAIEKELSRDGQVFYIYNRVETIEEVSSRIKGLVKEARVEYAHGQMTPNQIENIMIKFINHEIDVLVCTTILESGIDIPNANTIIIEDSDRFGLASLYQIRGRVGRSNKLAYAYVMYKKNKVISEIAEKRLKAIKDFTEFGSGFKIALRDLELRGAGNLLGNAQHGNMLAIGYDMYVDMLQKAIMKEKGLEEEINLSLEVKIDLKVSAYIPNGYILNDIQKITMYRKLSECNNNKDILNITDEFLDRYGDIPKELENLIKIIEIRNMCRSLNITNVSIKGKYLYFESDKFKEKLKYYIVSKDILLFAEDCLKELINNLVLGGSND